jgi:hypothetical protein
VSASLDDEEVLLALVAAQGRGQGAAVQVDFLHECRHSSSNCRIGSSDGYDTGLFSKKQSDHGQDYGQTTARTTERATASEAATKTHKDTEQLSLSR